MSYFYKERTDGLSLLNNVSVEQTNVTKSYWALGIGGEYSPPSFDDADVFKGSPWVIASPERWAMWGWFKSDGRKSAILQCIYGFGSDELGGSGFMASLTLTLKPTNYLDISLSGMRSQMNTNLEYIETIDSVDVIYSNSTQYVDDIKLRINWTFTPDVSFQMFLQPFNAGVDYNNFKRLTAPKTIVFEEYLYNGNPDFKLDSEVGTFVFRWEYSPGSTLFVVYNLNKSGYYSSNAEKWYKTSSDELFIKINYWFQL
jgi:hypothetical protein